MSKISLWSSLMKNPPCVWRMSLSHCQHPVLDILSCLTRHIHMWRETPSSQKSQTDYTLLTTLGEFTQCRLVSVSSRYGEILQQVVSLSSLGLFMRPFLLHPTQVYSIHCAPSTAPPGWFLQQERGMVHVMPKGFVRGREARNNTEKGNQSQGHSQPAIPDPSSPVVGEATFTQEVLKDSQEWEL